MTLREGGVTCAPEDLLAILQDADEPVEAAVPITASFRPDFDDSGSVLDMLARAGAFEDHEPGPSAMPGTPGGAVELHRPPTPEWRVKLQAAFGAPLDNGPTLGDLKAACAQMRHAADPENQQSVDEPSWHALIGAVRHCQDGRTAVHDCSKEHADYSARETDGKIDRHIAGGFGPTTCGRMAELFGAARCQGCRHAGNPASSPIVAARNLARERQGALAPDGSLAATPAASAPVQLRCIAASAFADRPVPERPWIIRDMIPDRQVTLLGGDGGVGKSLLALQLAVAMATGTGFLGTMPTPGPVLYLSAEDDEGELHRRLAAIVAGGDGLSLASLGSLHILPLAGEDAVLATVAAKTETVSGTPLWQAVVERAAALRARLVIIDNLADAFAGNENSRSQARQFVNLLRGLAVTHDLAVVLLGHPSVNGIKEGTGTSGSTAWNNSVRSRLYLDRVRAEDNVEPDPELRVLSTKKANYSATGAEVRMRWDAGRFKLDGAAPGTVSKLAEAQRLEGVFLDLLKRLAREGRHVSPNRGNTYAPTMLAAASAGRVTAGQLTAAMERLFEGRRITVETVGPPSKRRQRIVTSE